MREGVKREVLLAGSHCLPWWGCRIQSRQRLNSEGTRVQTSLSCYQGPLIDEIFQAKFPNVAPQPPPQSCLSENIVIMDERI